MRTCFYLDLECRILRNVNPRVLEFNAPLTQEVLDKTRYQPIPHD